MNIQSAVQQYSAILSAYCRCDDEQLLIDAQQFGQDLMLAGIAPEEIGEFHHRGLHSLLFDEVDLGCHIDKQQQVSDILHHSSLVLTEVLMAYGLAFRERTEQREQQLELINRQLETKVNERTRALKTAKEKAEKADEMKTAFLATMSHELRTPLNAIIGFTNILQQGLGGDVSDEQGYQLGLIDQCAQHLLFLINEILDISKIESGLVQLHPSKFDMGLSVDKILATLAPMAEKKGLVLCNDRSHLGAGFFYGDSQRFEQILINLINNAIKFTTEGSVRVSVTGDDRLVALAVSDTGIGIPADYQQMIFEPFRQVDERATQRQFEGTGLGLAISQKLALLMGGEITLTSEVGCGSTFTLTLPRHNGSVSEGGRNSL